MQLLWRFHQKACQEEIFNAGHEIKQYYKSTDYLNIPKIYLLIFPSLLSPYSKIDDEKLPHKHCY